MYKHFVYEAANLNYEVLTMKKIITVLKRANIEHTVDNVIDGSFLEKEITIQGKKATAIISNSVFADGIEVSIERPRSSTPYINKSFKSEMKVISYLHSNGII